MWPWNKIEKLQDRIEDLERDINYYRSLELSETDKKELEFLRSAIKDYVIYRYDGSWSGSHRFYVGQSLQGVKSDLTTARFYISVLEAQLGPDGIEAAKKVCERLQDLCKTKAIEAKPE